MVKAITIIPRSGPEGSLGNGPLNNTLYDGITINFSDSKTNDNFTNGFTDGTIVDSQAPGYQTGNTYMIMNSTWPGDSGGSNITKLSLNGTDLTTRYIPITFVPGDRAADYINMAWAGHPDNVGTLADNFEELKLVDVSTGTDPVTWASITIYGNNSSFDFLTGTVDTWNFSETITSFINVDATNNYIAADKTGSFNSNVSTNVLWAKSYAIQIKPKAAAAADTEKPVINSGTTGTNLIENSGAGQTVYTIEATDNVGVVSYAIDGTDASLLTVNSSTGVVTLNAIPNYENKSSYSFTVTATDAAGNTSDPTSVSFSILNVNEATTGVPTITGSALVGQTLTAVTTSIADPDGLGTFTYQWKRNGSIVIGTNSSNYTIQSGDVGGTITVSVSFTDGGENLVGPLTSSETGTVTAPNSPATGLPTITGTASEGGTLTANLGTIADTDGLPGSYTYQWKRDGSPIGGETSSTYTVASADVGKTITVTVSFTDNAQNQESRTSAGTDIAALDELTYFWTEYFADASNNIPADSTLIHYGIYNTTKISGVQFTYTTTTDPLTDVSYSIVDNSNNDTMVYKKSWPIHIINNTNDVAHKAMVFAGSVEQTINGMNTGVFAIVRGNITLATIVAVVDEKSDALATDQYALGEPANPPEITEPGGRKLGDINFDGTVNSTDKDILEAYLLNDTTSTFTVYDDGTTNNGVSGKTAKDIITDMTEYDWKTYVDVNNNNLIDVGDLVRLLSKVADPSFSMTNGT